MPNKRLTLDEARLQVGRARQGRGRVVEVEGSTETVIEKAEAKRCEDGRWTKMEEANQVRINM